MTKKIVILGTSGNCIDMLDTIACINDEAQETLHECVGFLDDNTATHGTTRHGVPVLGPLSLAPELQDCWFVNGIGSTATFTRKDAIIAKAAIPLQRFITLIHPSARISRTAQIGPGTVIFENVAVTSNVTIGMHVIILPNSVISHDVVIGDYTCITGGVCISGGTHVGKLCYLGTNCSIIGGITIGDYSMVGMGSVVLGSVADNSIVVGNPARFLRHSLSHMAEEVSGQPAQTPFAAG